MSLISRGSAPISESTPVAGEAAGVKLQTTSTVGSARTDLPIPDPDYQYERERAISKMTAEGLKPLTKEEQHAEHKMTKTLLKKYTANIFQCDYGAFSFPIAYSEPRSYLERTADLFAFLVNDYIPRMISETDPVAKLGLLTAGIVAGYHLDLNQKKVFNPMLGESYVGKWENGASIYAEQICHHPPLSSFQIYSPDDSWSCYASEVKFDVDSGISTVDVAMKGIFHLQIKDGPLYEWEFPTVQLSGQVKGDRIVKIKGSIEVFDVTNGLMSFVEVAPKPSKSKGIKETKASTIYGGIKKNDKKNIKISIKDEYVKVISGDYVQQVKLDDDVIWDINKDIVHRAIGEVTDDELLPSDVRFRFDRNLLILNNLTEADNAKTALEDLQRREEKMRVTIKKKTGIKI